MSAALIELLRSIPAKVRLWMLLGLVIIVAVLKVCEAFGVELPYSQLENLAQLAAGYLLLQSAANVKVPHDPAHPDAPDDELVHYDEE